jgi:hypothetical protein
MKYSSRNEFPTRKPENKIENRKGGRGWKSESR